MMKIITICVIVCSVLTCKSAENTLASKKQTKNSISGNFDIVRVNNQTVNIDGLTISFDEKDNSVFGYSGCNRFTGNFEKSGKQIKIGPLASTRMACESDRNDIESKILAALNQTTTFEIETDKMVFKANDNIILELRKRQSEITVIYKATTRGTFKYLEVNKDSIITSKDYSLKLKQTVSTPENTWDNLESEINAIDLNSLTNLEAPTKAHQYDGALGATLTINNNGNSFTTPIFDHGNPPKSIENIVNKVLSMAKLTKKQ